GADAGQSGIVKDGSDRRRGLDRSVGKLVPSLSCFDQSLHRQKGSGCPRANAYVASFVFKQVSVSDEKVGAAYARPFGDLADGATAHYRKGCYALPGYRNSWWFPCRLAHCNRKRGRYDQGSGD